MSVSLVCCLMMVLQSLSFSLTHPLMAFRNPDLLCSVTIIVGIAILVRFLFMWLSSHHIHIPTLMELIEEDCGKKDN